MRIMIDTNIIISAILFPNSSHQDSLKKSLPNIALYFVLI